MYYEWKIKMALRNFTLHIYIVSDLVRQLQASRQHSELSVGYREQPVANLCKEIDVHHV